MIKERERLSDDTIHARLDTAGPGESPSIEADHCNPIPSAGDRVVWSVTGKGQDSSQRDLKYAEGFWGDLHV